MYVFNIMNMNSEELTNNYTMCEELISIALYSHQDKSDISICLSLACSIIMLEVLERQNQPLAMPGRASLLAQMYLMLSKIDLALLRDLVPWVAVSYRLAQGSRRSESDTIFSCLWHIIVAKYGGYVSACQDDGQMFEDLCKVTTFISQMRGPDAWSLIDERVAVGRWAALSHLLPKQCLCAQWLRSQLDGGS
jgi:hypothetical protein